ncbi:MAG: fumarylacetoacetate hydrolase family protein [Halieaceae bacterium]|jgi:2-keto-4-pentenoate hydratase/2-oxohepta-3-ene-1,7-dioic acid hydratase in catechol pathway|nr:fumarylacetoacetate hydrolase family protein [Halieaceae bacterium]
MKLISFTHGDIPSYGILDGNSITDLGRRLGAELPDLKSLLGVGLERLADIDPSPDISLSDVELLPPIPNPGVIWCAGMNTHSHFIEAKDRLGLEEEPGTPMFFLRAPATIVGSGVSIEKPVKEPAFDYEGEIAIIMGKPCRNISEENALDYVAGYSCFNDGSARMYQIASHQMTTGKNAWRSGSMGPVLATADSVDLDTMRLTTHVNGQPRQVMELDDLIFSFRQLISHISEVYHLQPGDVIATGSAEGAGGLRDPATFLAEGDCVDIEVTGIGTLSNTVIEQVL